MRTLAKKRESRLVRAYKQYHKRKRGRHDLWSNPARFVVMAMFGTAQRGPNLIRYSYALQSKVYHGESDTVFSSPQTDFRPLQLRFACANPHPAFRIWIDEILVGQIQLLLSPVLLDVLTGSPSAEIDCPLIGPDKTVKLKVRCELLRERL